MLWHVALYKLTQMPENNQLDEFSYLWDGSEPGWTLWHIDHVGWEVAIRFGPNGPTIREIAAVRQLVDEFRNTPTGEVFTQLKGVTRLRVEQPFGNLEQKRFIEKANLAGLSVESKPVDRGGYVPVDADRNVLTICEASLQNAVVQRMIDAGVPIEEIHVD